MMRISQNTSLIIGMICTTLLSQPTQTDGFVSRTVTQISNNNINNINNIGWVKNYHNRYSNSQTSKSSIISQKKNSKDVFQIGAASFDDFEEYSKETSSSSDEDIFASLRARQDYLSSFGVPSSTSSSASSSLSHSNSGLHSASSSGIRNTKKKSQEELQMISNWKNAQCTSTIRLSLDDWVRRLAVDTYPLGVCGSASGHIYLIDLDKGDILDVVRYAHEAQVDDEDVDNAMRKMFGKHDGGGVLGLAIRNDIVVSAGREGGLQVFKIDGEETSYYKGSRGGSAKSTELHLKSEGMLFYLVSSLVTSMAFDNSGFLWVGSYDGFVRGFEYDDREKTLVQQTEPTFEMDLGSEVLHLSINDEINCGVASTASGEVVLFSLEEGEVITKWKPFGKGVGKRKREYARTAMIVQNDEATESNEAVWSIIAGGSEGSMFQSRLNVDSMGYVSESSPLVHDESLIGRFRPSHIMSIVSLSSPFPGLVVSGSQDGHIRVWDCSYHRRDDDDDEESTIPNDGDEEEELEGHFDDIGGLDKRPQCLYALTGFKVWLGSVFTNHKKLVSDGADNAFVVHDFSGEDENVEDFQFEDDDDLEDFLDLD